MFSSLITITNKYYKTLLNIVLALGTNYVLKLETKDLIRVNFQRLDTGRVMPQSRKQNFFDNLKSFEYHKNFSLI